MPPLEADPLGPVRSILRQGQRMLLPVSLINLVVGVAIAVLDTSVVWRFFGFVVGATGLIFLVVWWRGRDPDQHPLMQVLTGTPTQVRWVHSAREESPLGNADRAVLHVVLVDGEHFRLPVENPADADAAAGAILARCPQAERLPDDGSPLPDGPGPETGRGEPPPG